MIGIDISRSELAQGARQLGARATLGCARAQALPLRAASVEHVLSHMALMLMDESTKVLAELQRVLVPGGGFAAIVGARVTNCQVSETFLDVLRPFVSSLAWQPLRLGDRRWWDEAGIRDLLA
ncbi:MAG: class I SAM-dependent methyltransferase, partial [Burkholderiaceae bacterium]